MKRIIFSPRKSIIWFFSLLIFTVSFNSCKKEKEEPDRNTLLTGKSWVLKAMTINPPLEINGEEIRNLYSLLEPCEKDNLEEFDKDGTYIYDEGNNVCDDPQDSTGDWEWNSDKTEITVSDDDGSLTYKIKELTESKLVYTVMIDDGQGTDYTITCTLAKR